MLTLNMREMERYDCVVRSGCVAPVRTADARTLEPGTHLHKPTLTDLELNFILEWRRQNAMD